MTRSSGTAISARLDLAPKAFVHYELLTSSEVETLFAEYIAEARSRPR